jgi:hypothetical protein
MIHSEKSTERSIWQAYESNISQVYFSEYPYIAELNDHLIREFNRRVYNLGFYDLMWLYYDAGFRLLGN